jgi:hypothetical protein
MLNRGEMDFAKHAYPGSSLENLAGIMLLGGLALGVSAAFGFYVAARR